MSHGWDQITTPGGPLFCLSDLPEPADIGEVFWPLCSLGFSQGSTTMMSDTD